MRGIFDDKNGSRRLETHTSFYADNGVADVYVSADTKRPGLGLQPGNCLNRMHKGFSIYGLQFPFLKTKNYIFRILLCYLRGPSLLRKHPE